MWFWKSTDCNKNRAYYGESDLKLQPLVFSVLALREWDFMMKGGRDCFSFSTPTQPCSPWSSHGSCNTGYLSLSLSLSFHHFPLVITLFLDLSVSTAPFICSFNFSFRLTFNPSLSPCRLFYPSLISWSLVSQFYFGPFHSLFLFLYVHPHSSLPLPISSLPHCTLLPDCRLACMYW